MDGVSTKSDTEISEIGERPDSDNPMPPDLFATPTKPTTGGRHDDELGGGSPGVADSPLVMPAEEASRVASASAADAIRKIDFDDASPQTPETKATTPATEESEQGLNILAKLAKELPTDRKRAKPNEKTSSANSRGVERTPVKTGESGDNSKRKLIP